MWKSGTPLYTVANNQKCNSSPTVVNDARLGHSQSDCRKKSRDGLSTNQIAAFGGVVNQDGGPKNGVTKSVTWGVTRYQISQKNRKVMTKT